MSRRIVAFFASVFSVSAVLGAPSGSSALELEENVLEVPFPVRHDPMRLGAGPAGRTVVLGIGTDGRGRLATFPAPRSPGGEQTPAKSIELPEEILGYDVGGPDVGREALYLLTAAAVVKWTPPAGFAPLAEVTSIYRVRPLDELLEAEFMVDIDADGDLDIVLPDFDGIRVVVLEGGKVASRQLVPAPVSVPRENRRSRFALGVRYVPPHFFLTDMTRDGKRDLVLPSGNRLRVLPWSGAGFATEPMEVPLAFEVVRREEAEDLGEVDQSDAQFRFLVALRDFDRDGVPDLLLQSVKSEGVFDKEHTLELYLARATDAGPRYADEPSSRISSSTLVTTPRVADFAGGPGLDVAIGEVDFGVTALMSMLVTGGIDIGVRSFVLDSEGRFPRDAAFEESVEIEFDLSSGDSRIPVSGMGDLDGDGRMDLILGGGENEIRVFRGREGDRPFSKRAEEFGVKLPGNGDLVRVLDMDDDGRRDIVVRYGRIDSDERQRRVRIYRSKEASSGD